MRSWTTPVHAMYVTLVHRSLDFNTWWSKKQNRQTSEDVHMTQYARVYILRSNELSAHAHKGSAHHRQTHCVPRWKHLRGRPLKQIRPGTSRGSTCPHRCVSRCPTCRKPPARNWRMCRNACQTGPCNVREASAHHAPIRQLNVCNADACTPLYLRSRVTCF